MNIVDSRARAPHAVLALVLAMIAWTVTSAVLASRTIYVADVALAAREAADGSAVARAMLAQSRLLSADSILARVAPVRPHALSVYDSATGWRGLSDRERIRLLGEDRIHELPRGARSVITSPVKDADDWDVVGAVGLGIPSWRMRLTPALLAALAAACVPLLLMRSALRRGAREWERNAALVSSLAALCVADLVSVALVSRSLRTMAAAGLRSLARAPDVSTSLPAFPSARVLALLLLITTLLTMAVLAAAAWYASPARRPAELRQTLAAWAFLSPSLAHLLVFSLGPLLFALYLSFHQWDLLSTARPFIGFHNYAELMRDPLFWNAVRNTAVYSLYVPVTMLVALGVAVVLNQRLRAIGLLRAIVFLPYVASYVAIAIVWQWIYNPDYGLLDFGLRLLHLPSIDWLGSPRTSLLAVMIVQAWVWLGYMMVIYLAGLQGIPESLYEAARLDGARGWQRFRHVTVPLLRPVSVYLFITGVIWSFHAFTLVYVMTEGGPVHSTDVVVYQIYQNAWEFRRMGYAAAESWVLFAMLFVLTLLQWRLLNRRVDYA